MPFLVLLGLLSLAPAGESPGFDHTYAGLSEVLVGAVSDRGVDYGLLATRKGDLGLFLAEVAAADTSTFSRRQKLAFYVNAYNAYTVATILDEQPVKSIRDLDGGEVWKTRRFAVGGESITLDAMEHQHARKLADGRVHAVVNCASVGCPPLPPAPLVAAGIDAQLDAAARRWVRVNAYETDGSTLRLSRIFEWYAADFAGWAEGVAAEDPKHAAALGFIQAFGAVPDHTAVDWAVYDWSLNAAAR